MENALEYLHSQGMTLPEVQKYIDAGFQPMSVGENPWNPGYRIWTFTRTPELNAVVSEFYAELGAVNPGQAGGAADD